MAGILDPLFQILQTPMGLMIAGGLIAVGVYYLLTRLFTSKEDRFEIETFEDQVAKDLDEKFRIRGVKTKSALVQGMDFLGSVDRWMREKGKKEVLTYDQKKSEYVRLKKAKYQDYDLYLFRIWNTNPLFKFLGIGAKKYIIVNKSHIQNIDTKNPNHHQWNLKQNIQLVRWGGVFVTDAVSEDYVSDISIKRSSENIMTFMMNSARKVIYLETNHSKNIDKYATKKNIDRKSWDKYKRAEDIDEDDD